MTATPPSRQRLENFRVGVILRRFSFTCLVGGLGLQVLDRISISDVISMEDSVPSMVFIDIRRFEL